MLSIMNEIDLCMLLPLCVLYGIQNQIFLQCSSSQHRERERERVVKLELALAILEGKKNN